MAKLDARSGHLYADEARLATNLLSGLEAQILILIAAGKQTGDIAAAVGTDQAAVKEHIKAILRKAMGSRGQTSSSRRVTLRPSDFPSEMVSPFIA